jgi:hypothetical protein
MRHLIPQKESLSMNLWKPLALVSMCGLAFVAVQPSASATPPVPVAGNQPNMEAALAQLREARASLERAEHNKGGWRAKAIEATDTAIRETQRGIAFADTH